MRTFGLLLGLLTLLSAEADYVNWENHPVRPLALSPDGRTLALAHGADRHLLWFDVTTGSPVLAGQVPVGLDPVAVGFRTSTEAWVVNHVSDTVSIVDLTSRRVIATLATDDEPYDIVFAGGRAYVSCSQANTVLVFDPQRLDQPPVRVRIEAEEPRALAVSPDGRTVYAAIFESGNGTTILAGATVGDFPPNVVLDPATPWNGVYPPPNRGSGYEPAIAGDIGAIPPSGLIVREDTAGRWRDDNGGDWTRWVTGDRAAASGRIAGWGLADRDIARIDTATLGVSYVRGLMNIGMAIGVRPDDGAVTLVGTDAKNEVRWEPNLVGQFGDVVQGTVTAEDDFRVPTNLNPHLDGAGPSVNAATRSLSIGDPRGVAWRADGAEALVVGMGSNNVIRMDRSGGRVGEALALGEGPIGVVLDEDRDRAYVWNHFEASISTIGIEAWTQLERTAVFTPEPPEIREGRRLLYNTHETSGTGHLSCATCHVDARHDRLAWDLGDPGGETERFTGNCTTLRATGPCAAFHPMKGPMTTQTLQDIIGHEPLHWRGDRAGIEGFNPTFVALQARDEEVSDAELADLKAFLATIALPPNPLREKDNSLPRDLALPGFSSTGRFSPAGTPLPAGDALRGMSLFRTGGLVPLPDLGVITECAACHSLPTGMGVNGIVRDRTGFTLGGRIIADGPNGENHLGIVSRSTVNGGTFKVPQLRTLHEKVGFDMSSRASLAGFGFIHDGSLDTLARFLALEEFAPQSDQDLADLTAFMLSFAGSDLPTESVHHDVPAPTSLDTHAAVGWQATGGPPVLQPLLERASDPRLAVVLEGRRDGVRRVGTWNVATASVEAGSGATSIDAFAATAGPLTATVVPAATATRLTRDRDRDGVVDDVELAQGSSPVDAASNAFTPALGLWLNPDRAGHGFDLQRVGRTLVFTWYTYLEDTSPVWYQAVGELGTGRTWAAELVRYDRDQAGALIGIPVGAVDLAFDGPAAGTFRWAIDGASGSEAVQRFAFADGLNVRDQVGIWFDPADPGWGISLDTQGTTRIAVAYFHDETGAPRWSLGAGAVGPGETLTLEAYAGFCPACEAVPIASIDRGSLAFSESERRRASIELDVGAGSGRFERGPVAIVPLGDPALDLTVF
ncbi:MAG: YncE family protein [Pseudomonadota bacterium]